MSKERRRSLDSKWKLNKTLSDYTQHKKDKKGGGAGYLSEEKVKPRRAKGKFPCKKAKGDHKFKLIRSDYYEFMSVHFDVFQCEACGKFTTKSRRDV